MTNMVREPAVCGQFYPASSAILRDQIESMIDKKPQCEKVIGVVSPHAGYMYSGPVAGALFSNIEIPESVVILGPNHTGIGQTFSICRKGIWRMPMGDVKIDAELADEISGLCNLIKEDPTAHAYEHSIEVQLPFMQYFRSDFKIVPIILKASDYHAYEKVAEALAKAIRRGKRETLLVASSDMTHYEPDNVARRKDKIAIDAILKLDSMLLLEATERYEISMCGSVPVACMLMTAILLGAKSARLVKYQTSGDASGDYNAVVGYASVIIQ